MKEPISQGQHQGDRAADFEALRREVWEVKSNLQTHEEVCDEVREQGKEWRERSEQQWTELKGMIGSLIWVIAISAGTIICGEGGLIVTLVFHGK